MADDGTHTGGAAHCPECGTVMMVRLLELKGECQDEPEMLVLLDCPEGHVHTTLTQEDVVAVLTDEVLKRLNARPRAQLNQ